MRFSNLSTSRASLPVTACLSLVALAGMLIPAATPAVAQIAAEPHHHPEPSSRPAAAAEKYPAPVVTAEGTWTPLANQVPTTVGLMMLLTDGTVIASDQNSSNVWYKLTPDSKGHYANGTWTTITPMQYTRLFVLSQVLQSGKVFVAGGEYGNAPKGSGEIYDPIANSWSATASTRAQDSSADWVDGESMLLPNGKVLSYSVIGSNCDVNGYNNGETFIYDPAANSFSAPTCPLGNNDETSWVKLPDGSILALDLQTPTGAPTTSERYIPSTGQWIADAAPPAYIFSPGGELGGGFLLPNGKVFIIGGTNQTLLYTPSGSTAPGTWALGPTVPNEGGVAMGAQDAPAAEMIDGNILMAEGCFSNACDYGAPTYLFYYDYKANTLTNIAAPDGTASVNSGPYQTGMLDLPDGTVLYEPNSTQLYTFTPANPQVSAGAPVITSVKAGSGGSYTLTGTGFNGISMGADYGDEDQNATNYPIVSLTAGNGNVYYGRTTNWNLTGVATGSTVTTANMTLPTGLPAGTYQLAVSANGIKSAPYSFSTASTAALTTPTPGSTLAGSSVTFSWTPATGATTYALNLGTTSGGSNLYNSGHVTTTSVTATGLPTNGSTIYAELWAYVNNAWVTTNYTYTEASKTTAALTTPTPGSILSGSTVTFSWTPATGATTYALNLGTTSGGSNLYNSGHITTTSATATGLPTNSSTIYAELWAFVNNAWVITNYTYTAQ